MEPGLISSALSLGLPLRLGLGASRNGLPLLGLTLDDDLSHFVGLDQAAMDQFFNRAPGASARAPVAERLRPNAGR